MFCAFQRTKNALNRYFFKNLLNKNWFLRKSNISLNQIFTTIMLYIKPQMPQAYD